MNGSKKFWFLNPQRQTEQGENRESGTGAKIFSNFFQNPLDKSRQMSIMSIVRQGHSGIV